ncbi:hypothetical protein F5Y02DRAFT_187369 [Annulohypoxylon stygium]|nr:hypothetical protein F5Y02DRAFT_187369 [Annulohypoxylon stygium]
MTLMCFSGLVFRNIEHQFHQSNPVSSPSPSHRLSHDLIPSLTTLTIQIHTSRPCPESLSGSITYIRVGIVTYVKVVIIVLMTSIYRVLLLLLPILKSTPASAYLLLIKSRTEFEERLLPRYDLDEVSLVKKSDSVTVPSCGYDRQPSSSGIRIVSSPLAHFGSLTWS